VEEKNYSMSELFAIGICFIICLGFALLFGVNFKPLLHVFRPFRFAYHYLWIRPKKIKQNKAEIKKAERRINNMILYHSGDRSEILQIEGDSMSQIEFEVLNKLLPDSISTNFDD
jgi:hypothetical protein